MSDNNQTVDYYIAPKESFDATADAIRAVTGESREIEWKSNGFADVIVESGIDGSLQTALVTGVFDKDYTIDDTTIGRAFANCLGKYTISFPNLINLRWKNYTFEDSTFNLNMPLLSGNVSTAFRGFKGEYIYAPKITQIGDDGFSDCSNLKSAFFPEILVKNRAFDSCSSLEVAVLGILNSSSWHHIRKCAKLKAVDIVMTNSNNQIDNSFVDDILLDTLIIRSTTLVSTINISAFNGTFFASDGTGGTLYVPQDLISSYQTATNWSTILSYENNQILPIEGSVYETQYADGTPIGGAS